MITPDELLNSQIILKEVNELEIQIDAHLEQYFTGQIDKLPLLIVDTPREIVMEQIYKDYEKAGWTISLVMLDDSSQRGILIKQK